MLLLKLSYKIDAPNVFRTRSFIWLDAEQRVDEIVNLLTIEIVKRLVISLRHIFFQSRVVLLVLLLLECFLERTNFVENTAQRPTVSLQLLLALLGRITREFLVVDFGGNVDESANIFLLLLAVVHCHLHWAHRKPQISNFQRTCII